MNKHEPTTAELTYVRGAPAVQLRAPDGAQATVLLLGAQVVSWMPAAGQEQLYFSDRAHLEEGKPVRGGVPVIFPQFDQLGPLPKHGFARDRRWKLMRAEVGSDDALAVLHLGDDEATRNLWPHRFDAELTVVVGGARLDIELAVEHPGPQDARSYSFTAALHTYLGVREVEEASVEGLGGLRFRDKVRGVEDWEHRHRLTVDQEVDRIYFDTPKPIVLHDGRRRVKVENQGFKDAVIWNPWIEKTASFDDMAPTDFRRMLCIEAACIEEPVTLRPGEHWWGRQTLTAYP